MSYKSSSSNQAHGYQSTDYSSLVGYGSSTIAPLTEIKTNQEVKPYANYTNTSKYFFNADSTDGWCHKPKFEYGTNLYSSRAQSIEKSMDHMGNK